MRKTFFAAAVFVLLCSGHVSAQWAFYGGGGGGGGGDMLESVCDPAGGAAQVAFASELPADGTEAGQFLVWSTGLMAWLPVPTSDLFFDSATGRVGINQTSPERMLHITTDDSSNNQIFLSSDGGGASTGSAGIVMRNSAVGASRMSLSIFDPSHPTYANTGGFLISDGINFVLGNIVNGVERMVVSPTNITLFGGVAATDYRLIFNGATSDGGFIWRQADDRLETDANTTVINGLITDARAVVLADEAFYNLADATSGWGNCSIGDSQEWATFTWNSSGESFIISSSANVANSSVDGNLCIIDAGSFARIINRLGSSLTLKLEAKY